LVKKFHKKYFINSHLNIASKFTYR